MKIIKSYTHGISLGLLEKNSMKTLFSMYFNEQENFRYWLSYRKNKNPTLSKKQNIILNLLDKDRTVWIEGFGFGLNHFKNNIISIENYENKPLLKILKQSNCIFFSKNLYSQKFLKILKRKFIFDTLIIDCRKTNYMTLSELVDFLLFFKNFFREHRLIFPINLHKIEFNKLKFTYNKILKDISNHLDNKEKFYPLSINEYILVLDKNERT